MKRVPDYQQISKEISDACVNDAALDAAREEIYRELVGSVKVIKSHRYADDPSIAIKAAKEHLTLAGLYVTKIDHSGKVQFEPFKVSREVDA